MEWVKLSDRHPRVNEEVLVMIPVSGRNNIENGVYRGDGKFLCAWCDTRGDNCTYRVSHWMPLPKPPID